MGTSLSSSSNYINKKTTTEIEEEKILAPEWQAVRIDSLKDIGFTTTHLVQIIQQGRLSAEMIQDSIEAFAFDLKYNQKAKGLKGSPLNYFMDIVRNGIPYAPPDNYESPQDRQCVYIWRKNRKLKISV